MTARSKLLTLFGIVVAVSLVVAVAGSRALHRPSTGFRADSRISSPARTEGSSRSLGGHSPRLPGGQLSRVFLPRHTPLDTSGFGALPYVMPPWKPDASLEEICQTWQRAGFKGVHVVDQRLAAADRAKGAIVADMILKAALLNYEGETEQSYKLLQHLRSIVEADDQLARGSLGSVIYFQGVDAMRIGENENCIMCRGETSCILPIAPRRRPHQSSRLSPGDQTLHGIPPTVSRRPRGSLVTQSGSYDVGRVPGSRRARIPA